MKNWLEKFRRATEIQDDRGRLIAVPGEIARGLEDDAELRLIEQIDAKRPRQSSAGAKYGILMLVLILICASLLSRVLQNVGLNPFVASVCGSIGAFGLLGILSWPYALMERRREAAGLLWFRRCGVCESSLRGLQVQQDGCVVCPECSAAWRARRFASEFVVDRLKRMTSESDVRLRYEDVFGRIRTVHDVDGSMVLLTPPGLGELSEDERAKIPEADRNVLEQVMAGRFERVAVIVGLVAVIVLMLTVAVVLAMQATHFATPEGVTSLGVFVVALLASYIFGRVIVRVARGPVIANRGQYVAMMIHIGRCPSCATALRDADVTRDGSGWTCSRCESRWAPGWMGDELK